MKFPRIFLVAYITFSITQISRVHSTEVQYFTDNTFTHTISGNDFLTEIRLNACGREFRVSAFNQELQRRTTGKRYMKKGVYNHITH